MKKLLALVAIGIVVFSLTLVLLPLHNLFFTASNPLYTQRFLALKDPALAKVAPLFEAKCLDCHSAMTRAPLYMQLPGAKQMIAKDIAEAREELDLDPLFANHTPPTESALAKIEYVVQQDEMPPFRYKLMHWNAGLSPADKKALLAWVSEERGRHYASPDTAAALKGEVIQPLPLFSETDIRKVMLGRRLFHDKRLSHDNTLSCASCHSLTTGGVDRRKVSLGIGGQEGPINAPTVFNAAFHLRQFWDGRAATLEEQASGPVHNPKEMGSHWEEVLAKIAKDPAYTQGFRQAYGKPMNGPLIANAIAAFEETLVTPNSRFDQYLRGQTSALNDSEKRGYQLFKEFGCAACHVGKALGGQSFEKMGVKRNYFADRGHPTEADLGRYNATHEEHDRYKFKVPTLRNVALTAPYFHDGAAETLDQAVEMMAKYQLGRTLSAEDKRDVVGFLNTLTGEYEGQALE